MSYIVVRGKNIIPIAGCLYCSVCWFTAAIITQKQYEVLQNKGSSSLGILLLHAQLSWSQSLNSTIVTQALLFVCQVTKILPEWYTGEGLHLKSTWWIPMKQQRKPNAWTPWTITLPFAQWPFFTKISWLICIKNLIWKIYLFFYWYVTNDDFLIGWHIFILCRLKYKFGQPDFDDFKIACVHRLCSWGTPTVHTN